MLQEKDRDLSNVINCEQKLRHCCSEDVTSGAGACQQMRQSGLRRVPPSYDKASTTLVIV